MSKKNISMAIAYDFDGTLAYGNMQEHRFLKEIGISPKKFWGDVNALAKSEGADQVLIYMREMLLKAKAKSFPVRQEKFKEMGRKIKLFDGVESWFKRIKTYAQSKNIHLDHILISSGNAEIFAGTPIYAEFSEVYASKFLFDYEGRAVWPALAINYTTKTQYLFRINKGVHDLSDDSKVNEFVPKAERPVPFENMIYIGDGATDIPCFRLVKEQGGLSIAVFKTKTKDARGKAEIYQEQERVQAIAPADYTEGSKLDRLIKARIDYVAAREEMTSLYI